MFHVSIKVDIETQLETQRESLVDGWCKVEVASPCFPEAFFILILKSNPVPDWHSDCNKASLLT